MSYIRRIGGIATNDIATLTRKDAEYGGSWLKRGGVGAFMMLARKIDRLEQAMEKEMRVATELFMDGSKAPGRPIDRFDIIERALADGREEGILDDIGDLRRYLLLVEAEIRERMEPTKSTTIREAETHRLDPYNLPDGTCFDGPQSIH